MLIKQLSSPNIPYRRPCDTKPVAEAIATGELRKDLDVDQLVWGVDRILPKPPREPQVHAQSRCQHLGKKGFSRID
jgi:hypothetical protein